MFNGNILIVDDDPHIYELIKVNLENAGYNVLHANNGEEALETAMKENPDLIILDIMMPKLDGFEVCQKLRQNESTYLIPIIVLSARDKPTDKILGLKLGADDYITKPFDVDELVARIDSHLMRAEQFLAANPLTGLPGNVSIMQEINRRMRLQEAFSLIYIDVDNFKAYNDMYGFKKGDEIIKFVAAISKKNTSVHDFTGHIGGDDFLIVCSPEMSEPVCENIISQFDSGVSAFYNDNDAKNGYIKSKDRQGNTQTFSIMTLSIGLLTAEKNNTMEYGKLIENVTELKMSAKRFFKTGKSVYFKERRKE